MIANPSTKKKTVLKTKIKTHGNEVTHFHDKEMAKVGSTYSCLMVRWIDFVFKKDKNCY